MCLSAAAIGWFATGGVSAAALGALLIRRLEKGDDRDDDASNRDA
jgi:hypothetical protein